MALKRIAYRGVLLNQRTINMIEAAEKIYGGKFVLTQGSYNKGGVAKSAGTHDGGGAVDVRARDLTSAQRARVVLAMRQVGFAAWLRTPSQSDWPFHVHGIAVGDKELSDGAADQVEAYHKKRNGLASNGKDDGPAGFYGMTFEKYLAAQPKELFTVGQYENLMATIKAEGAATRQEVRRQAIWGQRYESQTVDERKKAEKAFDNAYDKAISEGKSEAEALNAGQKAAAEAMQGVSDDLGKRATQNG